MAETISLKKKTTGRRKGYGKDLSEKQIREVPERGGENKNF